MQQKLLQRAKGKRNWVFMLLYLLEYWYLMKSKCVSSFHFKIITVEYTVESLQLLLSLSSKRMNELFNSGEFQVLCVGSSYYVGELGKMQNSWDQWLWFSISGRGAQISLFNHPMQFWCRSSLDHVWEKHFVQIIIALKKAQDTKIDVTLMVCKYLYRA